MVSYRKGVYTQRSHRQLAESDWAAVHRELRRKQVTLSILSEEYISGERGDFFLMSQFW